MKQLLRERLGRTDKEVDEEADKRQDGGDQNAADLIRQRMRTQNDVARHKENEKDESECDARHQQLDCEDVRVSRKERRNARRQKRKEIQGSGVEMAKEASKIGKSNLNT